MGEQKPLPQPEPIDWEAAFSHTPAEKRQLTEVWITEIIKLRQSLSTLQLQHIHDLNSLVFPLLPLPTLVQQILEEYGEYGEDNTTIRAEYIDKKTTLIARIETLVRERTYVEAIILEVLPSSGTRQVFRIPHYTFLNMTAVAKRGAKRNEFSLHFRDAEGKGATFHLADETWAGERDNYQKAFCIYLETLLEALTLLQRYLASCLRTVR